MRSVPSTPTPERLASPERSPYLLQHHLGTVWHLPPHLLLGRPHLLQDPLPLHSHFGVRWLLQGPTLGRGQGTPSSCGPHRPPRVRCGSTAQGAHNWFRGRETGDRPWSHSSATGLEALGTSNPGDGGIHSLFLQPRPSAVASKLLLGAHRAP